jgi:hypothetical protein
MSIVRNSESAIQVGAVPHHQIVSLAIEGGFLDGSSLGFVDGLNCIIGSRGTGKTTVLEFIRFALGLMPDASSSPRRAKTIAEQVQSNLGSGIVRVDVKTKHRVEYSARRSWTEPAQILDDASRPTKISFDRDLIFGADIYSQNEIEEIASNPRSRLGLVDKFVEEEMRAIDAKHRKLIRDLEDNGIELLRVEEQLRDCHETTSELPGLEEKLQAVASTGGADAKILKAAHASKARREREKQTVEAIADDLRQLVDAFESTAGGYSQRLRSRIDVEMTSGENGVAFGLLDNLLKHLTKTIQSSVDTIAETVENLLLTVEGEELLGSHAEQEQEYRELLARTKEEAGRASERQQLQRRYAEVVAAQKQVTELEVQEEKLLENRSELTSALSNLRNDRFAKRKQVADWLTEQLRPHIRVSVSQAGNIDAYREMLQDALKGSGMKFGALVDKIVQRLSPREFAVAVQRGDSERLAERAGMTPEHADRVIGVLRSTQAIFRIQTVDVEDSPRIELQDGQRYKDSAGLSTGQRCTTILPILLLESERPLLIDQPEDNLDNKFIYDTVVKSLKDAKGRRQLIFVTHNPNIPVLGEADRVFVLESDGSRASVTAHGTVDEVKGHIETLLEGGRDAFKRRMERYGH